MFAIHLSVQTHSNSTRILAPNIDKQGGAEEFIPVPDWLRINFLALTPRSGP